MPMTLTKGAQATAPLARRWRVWIPMRDENVAIDADGPEAWVKGGHLFVGPSKASQDWTLAWAPGGWLSCELMADEG